ncbi:MULTISPECIES: hypothetical protein [Rhodococcus]|uniref:hypothetical protein n=1 Tax=Rhodococcus sp. P14 TaxID=450821 RepID=UPI0004984501|nr:hypothetical protein [Rhodococcus sp. P14]
MSSADTVSYRYVVKHAASGRWELRIYPMDTDSGARVPELFASHIATRDSRAECVAIAQAFHNLGDSYNEFGHGYHSRFDHALADAITGSPERICPPPAGSATTVTPRTPAAASAATPAPGTVSANDAATGPRRGGGHSTSSSSSRSAAPVARTSGQARTRQAPRQPGGPVRSGDGPTTSRRRAAAHLLTRRVFVETGAGRVHTLPNCRSSKPIHYWCTAEEAHYSRLTPCRACGEGLASMLRAVLGSIPDHERRKLPLPPLSGFGEKAKRKRTKSRRNSRNTTRATDRDVQPGRWTTRTPYGSPARLDDPRFSHRSRLEWGTASYGQDPEEFLGSPTDDDNEWRGGSAFYE